jgi:hypothetical protein
VTEVVLEEAGQGEEPALVGVGARPDHHRVLCMGPW